MPSVSLGRAATAIALYVGVLAMPAATAAKPLRNYGNAKVVSVDGPALLTMKTAGRTVAIRLFGVDAPHVGECGATQSVAALKQLVRGKRSRVTYELVGGADGGFARDASGRYLANLSPARSYRPIGPAVIAAGWAQSGEPLAPRDGPPALGELARVEAYDVGGGRNVGVWAICGGRMHLPLGQPAPAHAPVPWDVNADGQLQAIGPVAFPATLSPEATLTVAQVAAIAPVELGDRGGGRCWVRVPSLEIVLTAASVSAKQPCGLGDVSAVESAGPGAVSLTNGLKAGATTGQVKERFPLLELPYDGDDDLFLSGGGRTWAWQTSAWVDGADGTLGGFRSTLESGSDQ